MADKAAPDTTRPRPELDLAALRKVAEAATPSRWHWSFDIMVPHLLADLNDFPKEDVRHMATFDPMLVLSLLDRIEELTKERDFFRSGYVGANTTLQLIRDVNHGGQ